MSFGKVYDICNKSTLLQKVNQKNKYSMYKIKKKFENTSCTYYIHNVILIKNHNNVLKYDQN